MAENLDFSNPELYKNRELSWLQFEERILNEARDRDNRLLERLKFLSITGSNLDEFFMIRVATLREMQIAGWTEPDLAGLTAAEQLKLVSETVHTFMEEQYRVLNEELVPELKAKGIVPFISYGELPEELKQEADILFKEKVFPLLTPVTIDANRPFPLVRNGYLNVGGFVKKKAEDSSERFAIVQVPQGIERVHVLKSSEDTPVCILTEELIKAKFSKLFPGYDILSVNSFRVLRNADLSITREDASDLLHVIEKQVENREWGRPIRLEINGEDYDKLMSRLARELPLSRDEIYVTKGPINLSFLMEIYGLEGFDKLRKPEYTPVMPWEFDTGRSLFTQITEHDLMLIHPFESFKPVVDFIKEASEDEDVLAIKQTLYRVSGNSPIVRALARAAEKGKEVTVLVELKARFDEENNILWARMLEKAGCQVIYGFADLKTHCKITLVVRRENGAYKRYVHLGTGNYNDSTAKIYTDISFFTAKDEFGEDAANVFNMLSNISEGEAMNKLSLAPGNLRSKFIELIEREAEHAKAGHPNHIIAKVNSLCDRQIIEALYKASCAGVKIDLIVRGICCLRAGIKGVSENITVRSIVGNFLEHSRIYYFKNGGNTEYYCSSADWMPRNMDKRIEILFPVERKRLQEKLNHVLKLMLKDNQKAWILQPDGSYKRMPDDDYLYSFQEGFCVEEKESVNPADQ